jgi:hypothetical protein
MESQNLSFLHEPIIGPHNESVLSSLLTTYFFNIHFNIIFLSTRCHNFDIIFI